MPADRRLYVFLDEGGNLDFSPNGTKYFTLSSVCQERPFACQQRLDQLRYDLIEQGVDIEYFHAAVDNQAVRNQVFAIIREHLATFKIDSVLIEKRKTGPVLRPVERFYPKMLGYLLRHILESHRLQDFAEVIVITDAIPVKNLRRAVEKAVKVTLADMLPGDVRYRLLHHDSKAHGCLQVADYCNWAIYRKWTNGDARSYDVIREAVRSEFDIFRTGQRLYY
jgi:hypothetical protein